MLINPRKMKDPPLLHIQIFLAITDMLFIDTAEKPVWHISLRIMISGCIYEI